MNQTRCQRDRDNARKARASLPSKHCKQAHGGLLDQRSWSAGRCDGPRALGMRGSGSPQAERRPTTARRVLRQNSEENKLLLWPLLPPVHDSGAANTEKGVMYAHFRAIPILSVLASLYTFSEIFDLFEHTAAPLIKYVLGQGF